jgi:hypothetical protein
MLSPLAAYVVESGKFIKLMMEVLFSIIRLASIASNTLHGRSSATNSQASAQ